MIQQRREARFSERGVWEEESLLSPAQSAFFRCHVADSNRDSK